MRNLPVFAIACVLALPVVVSAQNTPGPAAKSDGPNLIVHRPNLLVADLDRALTVYRDILGFRVNVVLPLAKDSYMYALFNVDPKATMRLAFLGTGPGQFGALGLTEAKGVDLAPREGDMYYESVIIEVKQGLTEVIERLRDAGLEMGEPRDLDGPPRTDFAFTDFDGHRIVVFQLRKKLKQ
jgi:catechol 2,3-dioxygenase-like lactoylglutathione lyase family enzyme